MFVAPIDRPAPGEQRELEPWLQRMVDFSLAETVPTALPIIRHHAAAGARVGAAVDQDRGEFGPSRGAALWAFAWAGGLALARHVMDHPELVAGRRVLDFASGCGLNAIAAAKSGAAHVIATDTDPLAVVALSLNADANGVAVQASVADFWERMRSIRRWSGGAGRRAFYDPSIADLVLAFLARCRAAGSRC